MSYTALYREWRPKSFNDVVGQSHVTVTIKNQIKSGRIAHAYLLCGTRGTGKTSTAKILSRAVNCLNPKDGEPCNECEMCKKILSGTAIDVIEMDAASHRGIDKMRDVIEDIQYPPQEAKYKVYIIDEVHMLTIEAVNAFLKTLEEPPENVIFILATTDPQKLPVTILSRCQRFDFKRIKSPEVFERLRKICERSGVLAEDNALKLISRVCDGAMRDALSILDQAIAIGNKNISENQVVSMLGLVTGESLFKLMDEIIDKNIEGTLKLIDDIIFSGKEIYSFIKDFSVHLRNLMVLKVSDRPDEIIDMSSENLEKLKAQSQRISMEEIMRNIQILQEAEEQCKWSRQSRIFLELATIKMCKIEYDTSNEVLLSRINRLENYIRNNNLVVNNEMDTAIKKESSENQALSKTEIKKTEDLTGDKSYEISEADTKTGASRVNETDLKQRDNKTINTQNNKVKSQGEANNRQDIEHPFEDTLPDITIDKVKKSWRDVIDIFKSRRLMSIYACLITGYPKECKNGVIYIEFKKDYSFSKNRLEKSENSKVVDEIFSEGLKEKVKVKYNVESSSDDKKQDPEELLKKTFGEQFVEIIDE